MLGRRLHTPLPVLRQQQEEQILLGPAFYPCPASSELVNWASYLPCQAGSPGPANRFKSNLS